MDHEDLRTVEMSVLGRPFTLGTLYDCNSDSIVSGITLWDSDDLKRHIRERPQRFNTFKIDASDLTEGQFSALDVNGSLKASFLLGLVTAEGSAKYLDHEKTYSNQCKLTLAYKVTTKVQELSMEHLGQNNLKHKEQLDKTLATHVVTAILYGAQAFFVFEREVSENESLQDIQGEIKVKVFGIGGAASLKSANKRIRNAEKFICSFYGDFKLEKTPRTFQDAMQVYQSLPSLLGPNGENAVPIKVWMLPLSSLNVSAPIFRPIGGWFLQVIQNVMDDFNRLGMRCRDLLRATGDQFPQMRGKLQYFQKICSSLKQEYQSSMAKKLKMIRRGQKEAELAETLEGRSSSPFNISKLKQWVDFKEQEICVLKLFTKTGKNIKILQSESDLLAETGKMWSIKTHVCFIFTSLGDVDPYIQTLSHYVKTNPGEHPDICERTKEPWFSSGEAAKNMGKKAKLFSDFAEANKENQKIKFLVVGLSDDNHEGSTIYLYEDGILVSENFEPPSEPETVTAADVTHNSVTLKVSPPRFGAESITSYSVDICVHGEYGWKQMTGPKAGKVTLRDLEPNTEYMFRCRAATSAGVGPAHEVREPIRTLSCSPPGELHVEPKRIDASVSTSQSDNVVCRTSELYQLLLQVILQDLPDLEARWEKALESVTAQRFQEIRDKLRTFKDLNLKFKEKILVRLKESSPSGLREMKIQQIIEKEVKLRLSTPFNQTNLKRWMFWKEKEINVLQSLTNIMPNSEIISSQNLFNKIINTADQVVCFVFTSLGTDDPLLSALSAYLRGTTPEDLHDVEKEPWFASNKVLDEISLKVKLFSDFAEANKENQKRKFLVVGLTDDSHEGSTIYLYEDGISENFEPPSKPETATAADITHNSVSLKVSPPRFGAESITSYSVEVCVHGKDGWKQMTGPKAGEVPVKDLEPNTEYMFRCRAVTSAGVGPAYEVRDPIRTLPCSPPGEPHVEPNLFDASVTWKEPTDMGPDVQISNYILEYAETGDTSPVQWNQLKPKTQTETILDLQSDTRYAVRVRCDCGEAGRSRQSITAYFCTTGFIRPAELLRRSSELLSSGSPSVFKLPLTEERINIDSCRKFTCGEANRKQNRTIVLLGLSRSGASTLINGMINYIVGVEWEDSFRFKVVEEEHRVTSEVTVYQIYHQEGFRTDYSLTIVETIVDNPEEFSFEVFSFLFRRRTARIQSGRRISELLGLLFCHPQGVSEAAAVCLTVGVDSTRLSPEQRHKSDSLLSVFGKDMLENIRVLVTGADGRPPPVLESIRASGVPCPRNKDGLPIHFKFNESALFADNTVAAEGNQREEDPEEPERFDQIFWNMEAKSMKRFFEDLKVMKTKDLFPVKEVIRERIELEKRVEDLQEQIKVRVGNLGGFRASKTSFFRKVFINCQQCHMTCQTSRWAAMAENGFCTECPGRCYRSVHFIQNYRWRYEKTGGMLILLFYPLSTQDEVIEWMKTSSECLNRLKEISLKPDLISVREYMDLIIKGEKKEAEPGWEVRVMVLNQLILKMDPCAIS